MISHQHGFNHKHLTHTALYNICHQITGGFNNARPPQCSVNVALDIIKVLDTVKIHKLKLTNIPNIIIKFIANINKMAHSQNSNKSTLVYHKVEFCHILGTAILSSWIHFTNAFNQGINRRRLLFKKV